MAHRGCCVSCRGIVRRLLLVPFALGPLSGCDGFAFPGIPVELPLAQGVELSAVSAAAGSVELPLAFFCDLFNEEELDAMLRAAAGDRIADLLTITRVELDAAEITATEGSFEPFTRSTLVLHLLDVGSAPLTLGAAADDSGLGVAFALTRERPVDLLNDLEDGQCGVPTLRLEGASPLEPEDVTFDVGVRVLVYTELTLGRP